MALTFGTDRQRTVYGDKRVVTLDVTFDNSYPTGGEVINPSDVGMTRFDYVHPQQPKAATRIVTWDYANSKALLYTALSTEAANASDQSAIVATFMFIGE
jgi:hypothetical protein